MNAAADSDVQSETLINRLGAAQTIDDEVRKLLHDAEQRVRSTPCTQRAQLILIAKTLLREEVVDRPTECADPPVFIAISNSPDYPRPPSVHHMGGGFSINRLSRGLAGVTRKQRRVTTPELLVLAALFALPEPAWTVSVTEQQLAAALVAKPDLQRGARLFKACVACHKSDGGGRPDGDVPAIAGQYPRVLLRQLVDFHYGKRWDVRMEAIARSHSLSGAQDLADVAAYVSALPRITNPGRGDGQLLAHGMQVYQRQCASCHGPSALGDARKAVPWLAGQHYEYLLREMYYTFDHRRPNLTNHGIFLDRFTRPDYQGVADYLSGLISPPSGQ